LWAHIACKQALNWHIWGGGQAEGQQDEGRGAGMRA